MVFGLLLLLLLVLVLIFFFLFGRLSLCHTTATNRRVSFRLQLHAGDGFSLLIRSEDFLEATIDCTATKTTKYTHVKKKKTP